MRPVFLRGRGVRLCPFEPTDELAVAGAPWRLLSPGGSEPPIVMAAVDAEERVLGMASLEAMDWVRREADATLRWGGPDEAAAEAVRLLVGYAFDELNLDRMEARVHAADASARALLVGLGFAPAGRQGDVERLARARRDP